jgi:mono/diheme cytochrome c family protein
VVLARSETQSVAFVADEDARRVVAIDIDRGEELAAAELPASPGALLVSAAGKVAVTLPQKSEITVLAFDGKAFEVACNVGTAAEPVALALTPDERTLLVASAWGHALGAYASDTLKERYRLDLPRDPRAVIVSEDGERAFVSHGVGGQLSAVELAAGRVTGISLHAPLSPEALARLRAFRASMAPVLEEANAERRVEMERQVDEQLKTMLMPERFANQGYALAFAKGRGRLVLPQVEVDPGRKDMRSNGYGSGGQASAAASVALVDPKTLALDPNSIPAVPAWRVVGTAGEGDKCILPRSAAVDEAQGTLLVTCLGTDVLVGYDTAAPSPVDAELLRVRVPSGPTGVAVDSEGRRALVWSQFERTLSSVPLPDGRSSLAADDAAVRRIVLAPRAALALPAELALGRRLFHATNDPRIARDGRACASCHIGGRDDGLVWSTPGGPRRTKTLAGLLGGTAPYAWDGSAATLHDQIEGTFERLDGQGGLRAVELDALAAYVAALPAPPRTPNDVSVTRGAELFRSAATGCSSCHAGAGLSDRSRHGVSSETGADVTARFDTPSLSFLSGRAPYFHDGRYATLRELLSENRDKMGHTAQLSASDLAALETFLESL